MDKQRLQKLAGINELEINNPLNKKFEYPFPIDILKHRKEVLEKIDDFIEDYEEMGGEWEFIADKNGGEFQLENNEFSVPEMCSVILVPKVCLRDFLHKNPHFETGDSIYQEYDMNFITYDMGKYIYYIYE